MEIVLKLYTYVDGVNDTPFPNAEEQAMFTFTYDANRMGGSPQISATVKHRLCLDDLWNDKVYATFRGEKYFIMNTPSSDKDNTDERYNHDIELLSEREVLNHVYFIDAVQGDSTVDVYKSNSTKVTFFGDVNEFVGRLNACLSYQNLEYTAVLDSGVTSEDKQVSFEDKYILEALQEIFNVYEIPYYFVGKVIHVGFTENTITYPLKYGFDEALLSISKQNANYALINKIKGQGSSDNIPYYYPNNSPKGDIGIKIISGSMIASNFVIFDYVKFSSAMSLTDVCTVRREQSEDGILNYFIWSIDGKDVELSDLGIRLADNVIPMAGSSFMQEKVSYITPMQNLMPSIYRESLGAQQFYEAKNNTYEDGEGGYYEFENEYSDTNQRQGTTDFEDIKPTIEGMTNASGQRIDMFSAFAYDKNDNDETDEDGNYIHPYFFAKLRKFDGENGFNLFDHAIESQPMQISFTSGVCGACTFEIGVGEETQKNIVQVDDSGNLKRDENGNVLWENQSPQDRQNDTRNYEVWIALKKEDSTYGIVFPNASQNLKPSTSDTFVILGINLPTAYITAAEKRLEQSLIKYMWMNNTEKFTFSIKFSRIFFTEHPEVLEQLNENSRVLIEYNGQQHTLYVDNFSYKTDDSSPLPEIEIDLVDTLSVGQNSLQTQLDSVKQDILSSIGGGDFLKQGLKYFLRKDVADTAQKKITFREGIDIGAFEGDISGGTFRKMQDGSSYAEVDRLKVRVKAYFETLEIQNINSVGGKQIITPGGGVYVTEVVDRETVDGTEVVWDYYRCYFLTQQDGREIENRFKVGDLAISQNFNVKEGVSSQVTNHYYWREVVGIGDDYIDLSKSICDTDSDEPVAEDVICQLGNRTDVDRQGAIVFSAVDEFSPSITLYQGINDFSYVGKDYVSYGLDKTTGKSFFRVYGEMYVGDREQNTYVKYTQDNGVEIKGKLVTQTGKDVESTLNSFQDQIDGVKETFYGEYTPTLENYPANEWTTDAEKERHIGDVFTNIQAYVDDETTPDAGKSWRWMKNEEGGTYYWLQIADSDTSKAYYEAAKANQAAQEAKEQVTELNTTVDGLQNFTDEAFKDGIVDRSEASSISTYLNNIKSIQNSVTESYNKVYNNELLEGTDKTNLLNAYNAFNNATNELVTTIEGAIADGLVDTLEKASVDGKYDTFNTKYGDFIAYINAANKYIQDKINATAKDALDKIGEMSYITDALKQYTTIEGGLIQSSLLALGYTDADGFKVMSGTNGIYNAEKLGGGIASWWGGAMFDRFEYTEETMPSNVATGLVRFDGTGYFANGNLWWEKDGTLHADPLSFFVGEETVGDVLGLFQFIKDGDTTQYVIPQYPFQKLEVANDLKIGKGYLKWDEENNAIYVVGKDGSKCNFYSLGELSAGGFSDEGGSGTGGLFGIKVNGQTYTPENGYITIPDYPTSLTWANITGKPSWIGNTKPSYTFAEITSKPTTLAGYGIKDAYIQNGTIVLGSNNITPLTSSNYSGTLDSRYVKKSGDTMTGALTVPSLAVSGSTATVSGNKVWHAGNDGSGSGLDADTLDGTHKSGLFTSLTNSGNNISMTIGGTTKTLTPAYASKTGALNNYGRTSNLDDIRINGLVSWGSDATSKPANNGTVFQFSNVSSPVPGTNQHCVNQIAYSTSINRIYTRQRINTGSWTAWETIAYTNDNVASATKLQTARTIWGQSFDGTGNVSGNLITVGQILFSEDGKIQCSSDGYIGFANRAGSISLPIKAHSLILADYLNTTSSYRLHVAGTFYASGAATLGSTLNVSGLVTATAGLTTPQYIQIGKGRIYWDEANNALYVKSSDGSSAINFYSLGELSAGGYEEGSGEDVGNIFGIKVNGQTYKPVEGYITIPDYPTSLTWANITGKPSWIGNTKPSYTFAEITSKPTTLAGYGIKDAYIQNGTIVLGSNNITPLTSSNYSGTLDSRYVKKSGDTMTGALTVPSLAVSGSTATVSGNKVWHAGNDGSGSGLDADTLDGTHKSGLFTSLTNSGNNISMTIGGTTKTLTPAYASKTGALNNYGRTSNLDDIRINGLVSWGSDATSKPANNGTVFQFSNVSSPVPGTNQHCVNQIAYSTSINRIYTRQRINTGSWTAWETIAYTNDNVASATKLQTARTIWGQSFDGTGNVSGNLITVGQILFSEDGKIQCSSDGYIGFANRAGSISLPIKAHSLILADYLNTTSSYRLHVAGTFYASGAATLRSTLNVSGTSAFTGKTTHNGGIYTTDISGNGSALYLGNSNNKSYVYLREDMKASSGNWSIATSGAATFSSLTINGAASFSSLSVSGASTFTGKTTHNGGIASTYATLSSYLTVNGQSTFNASVGIKTSPISSYSLAVSGNTYQQGDSYLVGSKYINGIRVYKDTDGYLCIQGNLKITGNVAAAGEVAAGQTLTGLTDFLYDVTSFDSYSSTATNRAPTARAVKLIKDKVSSVSSTATTANNTASSVKTKMNSINTYLSQITSSTTLDQLKTILMNLANAI